MRKPALALALSSLLWAVPHLSTLAVENSGNLAYKPGISSMSHPPMFSVVTTSSENGEHYLYAKVIESYRKKQLADLLRSVEMMAKAYPHSAHLDNAFYLTGLLYVNRGEVTKAQAWFDRVLETEGDKVVSALFAKAQLARKQKNGRLATQLSNQIVQQYPGSYEAQQLVNPNHKEVLR